MWRRRITLNVFLAPIVSKFSPKPGAPIRDPLPPRHRFLPYSPLRGCESTRFLVKSKPQHSITYPLRPVGGTSYFVHTRCCGAHAFSLLGLFTPVPMVRRAEASPGWPKKTFMFEPLPLSQTHTTIVLAISCCITPTLAILQLGELQSLRYLIFSSLVCHPLTIITRLERTSYHIQQHAKASLTRSSRSSPCIWRIVSISRRLKRL